MESLLSPFTSIPICGPVSAGRPGSSTDRDASDSGCIAVDLTTIGVTPNARTFALRVQGNSMEGAHILNGDTVVLQFKPPHDGAIVAALVDGQTTISIGR